MKTDTATATRVIAQQIYQAITADPDGVDVETAVKEFIQRFGYARPRNVDPNQFHALIARHRSGR